MESSHIREDKNGGIELSFEEEDVYDQEDEEEENKSFNLSSKPLSE